MDIHPDVELAIDLAARDVAKAFSDHNGGMDVSSLKRAIKGFISMAVVKASVPNPWEDTCAPMWMYAAEPGALDPEVFSRAINKWWDSLDAAGQVKAIMENAGHHKSEYINNISQKYKDKPESLLMRDMPELAATYREELGGTTTPAAPAPSGESIPVAPNAPTAPKSSLDLKSEDKARPYKGQNRHEDPDPTVIPADDDLNNPQSPGKPEDPIPAEQVEGSWTK